ncbi:hypothetical protein [Methylobacterium gnaphalii]|uniref:Uncharacterized protein n=1 Tax=Methylobacterium gnaphalii TaxID=1010610 RepID=A0A512JIM9_9HYPH|nr:hypothetical protein [Methylobacterium gnaphalii]GEP09815.1 hypothetical protein MGN01_16600 [Methylobacterium gnaphalii]GJD67270.1 hypothetical protein MMMDOFMJ_0184 [Methylobacterium gnaphalii]GLS49845.1 hypothetical protein GCM10007885_26970 [Methylobacterium gnaphalii]
MATKKIVASVTLHVPAKGHKPFEFDAFSNRIAGDYKVEEKAPGSIIDIDEDEADALIAAGKAELYEEPKAAAELKTPPAK